MHDAPGIPVAIIPSFQNARVHIAQAQLPHRVSGGDAIHVPMPAPDPPGPIPPNPTPGPWTGACPTGHACHSDPPCDRRSGSDRRTRNDAVVLADSRRLDEQLRQAQKMDTVGRLAGGVVHDFNNMLTAIFGFTDLLENSLDPSDTRRTDVAEIQRATERAANLARQFLAFICKQMPKASVVDLNTVVTDLSKMLRRLLGEDIDLTLVCDPAPCWTQIDSSQAEQVLLNLAVNARDAMPSGGRLSIETAALVTDAAFEAAHPGVAPGRYVTLTVADTGTGMDEEVRAHLFEPFFTTKEQGHGTGLGLTVVHDIVEQSNGHIFVDSAPGRGTRFTIILPATDRAPERERQAPERERLGGTGTVLLVEDEPQLRLVSANLLRRYGYTVLEAANGEEALALVREQRPSFDLLITDVVMPKMGGRPLASALRTGSSPLKVLYVSGYANLPDLRSPSTEPGVAFLEKPFTPNRLLSDVRSLLSSEQA